MSANPDWLSAFPLRPASQAVDALCESWRVLAARERPKFHRKSKEPQLTRVLKAYVQDVVSKKHGLLGSWSTEGVINKVDFETGEVSEERRTDIVYAWNNEHVRLELVFEFKKLDRLAKTRKHYLGKSGLLRFVTGLYARQQPVAAMVGILIDPFDDSVPPLREALGNARLAAPLCIRAAASGQPYSQPSILFAHADFDTEHDRPAEHASAHGSIRVSHLFLPFGYDPGA